MTRRPWTLRIALWAAVGLLLLKSAMPLVASAVAQAQGKNLVEVCTLYGVATVVLDADGQPLPAGEHAAGGEHCALSALMALATPDVPPALPGGQVRAAAPPLLLPVAAPCRDACATWVALLHHGPPAIA